MTDNEIIDLSNHYNMVAREFVGRGGYYSLSTKDPKHHKNWKYFVKLADLCEQNGWNPKQYIEVQFERAKKYWKGGHYPLPSMLCSTTAVKYFKDWYSNQNEIQEDNPKFNQNKSRETYSSIYDQMMDEVMEEAERVDTHMWNYFSNRGFKHFQLVNEKMKYIVENYWTLSPYYLFTYKFIREDPERLFHHTSDYKYGYASGPIKKIEHIFSILSSNKKMAKVAVESRIYVEKSNDYFVYGEFNILDSKCSEEYFRKSLLKLGYSNNQINQQLRSKKNLGNTKHVSSLLIMTSKKLRELEEEEELEEESD